MAFVVPPTWRAWLRADRGPARAAVASPTAEPGRGRLDAAAPAFDPTLDPPPGGPRPQPPHLGHRAVGQHLRESALLDDAQIEAVLSLQRAKGLRFGEAALSLQLVTRAQLLQALARQFDFPLLAPGPCGLAPELVVAHDPFGVAAEHYRSLRSQLMGSGAADGAPRRALAVVSSAVGDGKSTTAANLAISFSQLGLRTLLVDANLRRPSVHRLFGLDRPMGLGALLGGRPDTALCGVDGLPGLSLLPAGGLPPNPLELIERPTFALLMQQWLERFDQVIVDTPAAAQGADARVLAARCGSALVVARPGRTPMAPLHRLVQAMRADMHAAPRSDLRAAAATPAARSNVHRGGAGHAAAVARAEPAVRDLGIDALKGAGIALVVLGHAFIGLIAARLAPADGWMAWAHYTVYLFHMPLFFVLSGLFVARRLGDAPPAFLAWLGRRLLWPYLLWSTLQLAAIHAAGAAVNTPATLTVWRLVGLIWAPASQYWFLHALALFHLLAQASGRVGGQAVWLPATALLLLAFVFSGGGWPVVGYYVPFLLWYAAGATLGSGRFNAWLQAARGQTLVLVAPLLALVLLLVQVPGLRAHEVAHQAPQTLGAQLAGVAMVLLVVARSGASTQRLLAWLGRRSMAIFLMHVMAVAGCRVALMRLPVALPAEAILGVSVAMGLLLPCLVQWAAQRAGVATWLGLDRG